MIKLKELLNERKFGEPLPTLKSEMEKHQSKITEARFRGANGQGINAKVTKKGDETIVSYYPKDWGTLLTKELLIAMVKKLGEFRIETGAGLELGRGDVKKIKGTKDGLFMGKMTITNWKSFG